MPALSFRRRPAGYVDASRFVDVPVCMYVCMCVCRHNYGVSENQSRGRHVSFAPSRRRRNRASLSERSPSGREPPRQIVWKRAVMRSRSKMLVRRRRKKIGQGRGVSLAARRAPGRPFLSCYLTFIDARRNRDPASQVSFVSSSQLTLRR